MKALVVGNGRLPDFIVVGAMKAGTTTFFRQLGRHPDVWLPQMKEPSFFNDETRYQRGVDWYRGLFPVDGYATGEASVAYSDPAVAPLVAERIGALVPEVKIIFLARDPEARLRSHYLHECLKGRERRPLEECLRPPGSPYERRSLYFRSLVPFVDVLGRDNVLVVASNRLVDSRTWAAVQDFLGLERFVMSAVTSHNVSDARGRETLAMRSLRSTGALVLAGRVPAPLRRLSKPLFSRRDRRYEQMRLEARTGTIPPDVHFRIQSDISDFQRLIGWTRPAWAETRDPGRG